MVSRRDFVKGMCSSAVLAMAGTMYPGLVFANAYTENRLVVVILRGGMDGMAALAPYADKNYGSIRGDLTLNLETLLRIDPFFGLHPSLEPLAKMYQDGDMIAIPATATPYRDRSHFDAQNVLELGSIKPNGLSSGWLNRVVAAINAQSDFAMAFGQGLPEIFRGNMSVNSWAPSALPDVSDDYISLVQKVYAQDKVFAGHLSKALNIQTMSMDALKGNEKQMTRKSRSPQAFVTMAKAAGEWMAKPSGPRIATLELGGWDTHVQQGTEGGRMANNLSLFARGIDELKKGLGSSWNKTIVMAVTEFGRTARPNGNRGTDHGTAGTTFLMGGALKGGRVIHKWPGLSDADLHEGRDVRPTIDIREIMKAVLHSHYGISKHVLSQEIYPNSKNIRPLRELL